MMRTSVKRNTFKWGQPHGANGYVGLDFDMSLKNRGVVHEVTTAYPVEFEGCVESLNRTLPVMVQTCY